MDASPRQIAQGWKIVDTLGLKNIELQHLDILAVNDALGKFDYSISHGVYSSIDSATGVTRETAKKLAERLSVDETQAIHHALHGQTPKLGTLHPSLVRAVEAALRATKG